MSVSLLPIRLGHLRFERPVRKHRAVDEVERLRLEVDQLQRSLVWAHLLIKTQRVQLDDADRALTAVPARQTELEERVVQQQARLDDLAAERDQLAEDLTALRLKFGPELAAEANANAITVPPMIRDTSALEDQATQPIDVRTLQEAAAAGLLGIRPVTDPGRIH